MPSPLIRKKFSVSIRSKILLVSLTLLVIPGIGYQYIQEMEAHLRAGQENSLLDRARIVASILNEQPDLFKVQEEVAPTVKRGRHLFVRPLESPIQLDGYTEDWLQYKSRMQTFGLNHLIYSSNQFQLNSFSFLHQVGSHKGYLYVVFQVIDDKVVYRQPNSLRLDRSDHIQIAMQNTKGRFQRYLITTQSPGWVNGYLMSSDTNNPVPLKTEVRIKGEWQETDKGYNVEIRIPISMIGDKIGFAVLDVDDARTRKINAIISTAGTRQVEEMGTIVVPSPEIEKILKRLESRSSRIWVVDWNSRVIALSGSLTNQSEELESARAGIDSKDQGQSVLSGLSRLFYRWILKQPATEFVDDLSTASSLEGAEMESAVNGTPATRWRQTPDQRVNILTAAYPIKFGDRTLGAVVLEETSNSILILQNRAMEILVNLSLLAFLFAVIILLTFATRLSMRITRLRDDADNAIGTDGRVKGSVQISGSSDELGDLSRSFSDMIDRLAQYNRYLETMASKLSHELRTPISVVRSSLDNLDLENLDDDSKKITGRAREGVERLSNIITRMSEATRLEQTLQQEERVDFDIEKVIEGCVEGYKLANPDQEFLLEVDRKDQALIINGEPDLIAQMLDKLISNAMDFCRENTSIDIRLLKKNKVVKLVVLNEGPALPDQMQNSLFDSMVSMRDSSGDQPHLGLGLYIVRMITEFHHGTVTAENRDDKEGVMFNILIPLVNS